VCVFDTHVWRTGKGEREKSGPRAVCCENTHVRTLRTKNRGHMLWLNKLVCVEKKLNEATAEASGEALPSRQPQHQLPHTHTLNTHCDQIIALKFPSQLCMLKPTHSNFSSPPARL